MQYEKMQEEQILILYFLSLLQIYLQPIQKLILYFLLFVKFYCDAMQSYVHNFRILIAQVKSHWNQIKRGKSEKLNNDVIYNISKYCEPLDRIRIKLLNKNLNQRVKITKLDCINALKPVSLYHNLDSLICFLTGKYWSKYFINDKTLLNYPDLKILDIRGNLDITPKSLNKLNLKRITISSSNEIINDHKIHQMSYYPKLLRTVEWEIKNDR